ncbi:MAG: Ppx/GppA family phosphatase [Myxococcales bacterium]|nr:Ppx/GppA family phosphatase [Myxococcales bacterium]
MPRFAAIDVGSNAMRLRVVEASGPEQVREVAAERAAVRLGHDVFLTGRLAPAALVEAVDALRMFREVMREAGVEAYRAVATSAVREAQNAEVLVERAAREAGIKLEIIEGVEEARLVLVAVLHAVKLAGRRALLVDIGGGSVELTTLAHDAPRASVSLPLGTVRLQEAFLHADEAVSPARRALLDEYLERLLGEAAVLRGPRPDLVVATGGNAEAISDLVPAATDDGAGINVASMLNLRDAMSAVAPRDRRETWGLRGDRADVIVPALFVLSTVATRVGAREVVTPGVGLKDGILAELVDRAFRVWDERGEAAEVEAEAVEIGRRYHFDERHARHVTELACSLYDQFQDLHKLDADDRKLLRLAALLHDVGDYVGFEAHHKHSHYLITHSDLMGLTPEHKEIVANVARYHRKALPDLSHPGYRKLDRRGRMVVRKLAALLRVADSFDREHLGKVADIAVRITPGRIALRAIAAPDRLGDDLSLERWTALRKADLMEDVFEHEVRVDGSESLAPPKPNL